MGEIHTIVGLAVESANRQARELSLKIPKTLVMAVITKDTAPAHVYLAWCTPEQIMASNDVECGWWKGGRKLSR